MSRIDLGPNEWIAHPLLARETYERMTHEGILVLSLDAKGRANPMTVGWGGFGSIWGRPIFCALVRPSRYTNDCMQHTGDFTVNVLPEELRDVADYCGTTSGRTVDKLEDKDLTAFPSKHVKSPGIEQANIVLECKVIHTSELREPNFPREIITNYYPDGDFHNVYYGQVMHVSARSGFMQS